ncbi:threonine ammonia-lyase [Sphingosinicella microcystinivorans]|uniref:threonine ammonia-lyase n=1 Tax=Sphingosinicella microcystinivorans TaxID=335406 RepID=UPI0022F3E757|nr:threonine/serine dehydratase [Sphingosinicella microcystinivorans]WBX83359.1 threonine/serine dehydratase [Sphingosinicella microcystinivorans]
MNTPTLEEVKAAAARIAGVTVRTPLLRSDTLDSATGAKVWLKAECLQRTGSFKFRGAWNRLSALSPEQRREGVVAFSSGNHAQGVALAARLLGIRATIVMPSDAPRIKADATRGYGAEIVSYDRLAERREVIAAKIAEERGGVVVPSFDDPYVVAGQGTAGLEIAEDIGQPDVMLVCCGGGGLASGIALALPESEIVVVEPEGYDDVTRSLAGGAIEPVRDPGPTLCDALQTLVTAPLTFGILQGRGARGVAVSEAEVKAAVAFAFRELKLVVEPGGAAALAAALSGKLDLRGKTVALTLSGGNVDAETYRACLGA